MEPLNLLQPQENFRRLEKVRRAMADAGMDSLLACDFATVYYLAGRVFDGFALITSEYDPVWFVKRPIHLGGERVCHIRKPEEIPGWLDRFGVPMPKRLGMELDLCSYSLVERLKAVFPEAECVNASQVLRTARAVKTDEELAKVRLSGAKHVGVYSHIPSLYTTGMTDYELQVAIEYLSRKEGCLGQFRISGSSMELFMGNVISGENADAPSPYDFAMGGKGMDPSLPVGAAGEEIHPGCTVMVDVNGNFTGYMTDMTRVYSLGTLPKLALDAHQCSLDIHKEFRRLAVAGASAKAIYEMAANIAAERGFEKYFMGHTQHAGFVGHGVGIEINELPVLAPRSRDILDAGNVVALEPKFVIPGVGAVGIENTYIIHEDRVECVTDAPEDIITLD